MNSRPLPRKGVLLQMPQGHWVIDYGDEIDVAHLFTEAEAREYASRMGIVLVEGKGTAA